jgi:DNA-binding NtrC family response regulator
MSTQPVQAPAFDDTSEPPTKRRGAMPLRKPSTSTSEALNHSAARVLSDGYNFCEAVALYEQKLIAQALKETKGVKKLAAARLGISRVSLFKRLKSGKAAR